MTFASLKLIELFRKCAGCPDLFYRTRDKRRPAPRAFGVCEGRDSMIFPARVHFACSALLHPGTRTPRVPGTPVLRAGLRQ
jgi:hypothetical protein